MKSNNPIPKKNKPKKKNQPTKQRKKNTTDLSTQNIQAQFLVCYTLAQI